MPWPAADGTNGFWLDDLRAGAVETWEFEGAAGLARLAGPQLTTAPIPASFRASLRRMQLDHVALEHFSAGPHSVERGPAEIAAYPTSLVTLIHLLTGGLQVRLPGTTFDVRAGQSILLDSRQSISATSDGDCRALRSVVGIEHIPAALHCDGATVQGALPRTALLNSFVAFIGAVLRSARRDQRPQSKQLSAAIAQLQAAVLVEAQEVSVFPCGPAGLRHRIEEHIRHHHTDPGLDVAAIARALDISVRHAHGVFNEGDRTIAAVLRDRRAVTAALLLRGSADTVSIGQIAHDAGFTDRDVLTRAFKQRYGTTPTDYHDGGRRAGDDRSAGA